MKAKDRERRRGKRFKLSLPVQLNEAGGITRDISTSGIFFETEHPRAVGDWINLFVEFRDSTLQCEGHVVRVEKLGHNFGIAVELALYRFH